MNSPDSGALGLIGNTPIIRLRKIVPDDAAEVWLKFEAGNPTGSYKDHFAAVAVSHMLSEGKKICFATIDLLKNCQLYILNEIIVLLQSAVKPSENVKMHQ